MPSRDTTLRAPGIPDRSMVTFHDTLRVAIQRQRLTLQVVCKRLAAHGYPVGVSTLGDWQHGKARPASVPTVHALEKVLGLPLQTLSGLIPRTELSERHGALGDLFDDLPGARDRTVDVLSRQDRAWVDAAGRVRRIACRTLLRARRDGVDRYILPYFADPGSSLGRVDIEALANCSVGAVRQHERAPLLVAELLFGQRLEAGETWLLEYRWTDPAGEPSCVLAHAVRHRIEQYVLEIVFDADAVPVRFFAFTQSDFDEPLRITASLPVSTHRTVHLIGSPLLTGLHGITWQLPT